MYARSWLPPAVMLLLPVIVITPVYPQVFPQQKTPASNQDNGVDRRTAIEGAASVQQATNAEIETRTEASDNQDTNQSGNDNVGEASPVEPRGAHTETTPPENPLTEDQPSGNGPTLPQLREGDVETQPPASDIETGSGPVEAPAASEPDYGLSNISTEEQTQISDEELEFLYQSGSLKDSVRQKHEETANDSDVTEPDTISGQDELRQEALQILGDSVLPREAKRLHWVASETFYGGMLDTPVHVIRGSRPGLTLCMTAAVHGDELNGVEIVRRLINGIEPEELTGTIIGVPIVNLLGFTRGSRYLPDRRDLNRYFPGNPRGSSASRIANSFMLEIVSHCDRLVDLHTGSLNRTNMPQLRANLDIPEVVEFTRHFGSTAVLHSRNIRGNLRTAATDMGIPAVTLELGEPGSLQEDQIDFGVKVMETLLDKLGMVKRRRKWSQPQPVYYNSRWVRVNNGGLLTTTVKVGAKIKQGSTLGIIVNPITSESYKINSPYNGRVLGMSLNQFMLPGYAAFNIGIVTSESQATLDAQSYECQGTGMSPDQVTDEFDCSAEGNDEVEAPYDERDEMIDNLE